MTPADLARLRRRLHPQPRGVHEVRRIMRRMRHYGGPIPPQDGRGNRRPCTFLGIVGMVLFRRAARRKVGRAQPRFRIWRRAW